MGVCDCMGCEVDVQDANGESVPAGDATNVDPTSPRSGRSSSAVTPVRITLFRRVSRGSRTTTAASFRTGEWFLGRATGPARDLRLAASTSTVRRSDVLESSRRERLDGRSRGRTQLSPRRARGVGSRRPRSCSRRSAGCICSSLRDENSALGR